ncbi:MAG: HAMP domain-containing protein, partial [Nitrospirae bacterium]
IVRMDGTVAVSSRPDEVGRRVSGWSPAELARAGVGERPAVERTEGGQTVRRLIPRAPECGQCHHDEGPYRGAISLTLSGERFQACMTRLGNRMAAVGSAAALASAGLLFGLLTWRVNRPLDEMVRTLKRVSEAGDLDARVDLERKDEFGALAEGFNRMMERLKQQQQELEAHHQREMEQSGHLVAVGEMVGVISHELRNPLAGIRSAIQVLVSQAEEGGNREILKQLDAATQRLDSMLGSTLDLLRPNRMVVEFTDLNEALEQALFFIRRDRRRGVELKMELAPDLPLIHVDREQIQQVFLNLALNALQAMGKEGTLTITTAQAETPEGRALVVRFADTGPGIPPDRIERIFEPLYTTRPDGTGLGLSTSKRIVERHGGTLTVESEVGKGAVFTVTLPLGMEPGVEEPEAAEPSAVKERP